VKTGTGVNTGGGAARRGRSAAKAEPARATPARAVERRSTDFMIWSSLVVPYRPVTGLMRSADLVVVQRFQGCFALRGVADR
jgi:hypothetical protein